jgi:glycine hydroxymethyltransferase
MHVIAAKAVAFGEAMQAEFKEYQRAVLENAQVLAGELQRIGFRLVSGGTDTHLVLIDLRDMEITGKTAEEALDEVGISVNRNSIPFDPRPPRITSGVRLGTPALTTRGFGPKQMIEIADLIYQRLSNLDDENTKQYICQKVEELSSHYNVPGLE